MNSGTQAAKEAGNMVVLDSNPTKLIEIVEVGKQMLMTRISATAPAAYNGAASTGSNLGPTNPDLTKKAQERIDTLRAADPGNEALVPVDLVTSSASGLDPDISPASAEYQVRRVARVRGLSEERVRALVTANTQGRGLTVLGEPRVNVLLLNLALDGEPSR